ncbi:taste receptor type 2 member 143-like [Anomaloglossus baeobatrachus]|uniref:taste receptor type 2 member 143-like n=1 Tax=Anomaloglossus baeobatrachus TaxID=238106 RepID=UPI003F4FA47D
MRTELKIARFIFTLITGVCGTFLNSSIVALNFRSWKDTTTSGGNKRILLSIGLINILFQGSLMVDNICESFSLYFVSERLFIGLLAFELTLINVNVWNTTWLSIFYCVRLVNYNHGVFLWIKAKFSTFLPQLLVGSVLISATINFQLPWTTILQRYQNTTQYQNMSGIFIIFDYYYTIFCILFGFIIPFCVTCVSIGFSVITLVRHICSIGYSDSHLTSDQLHAHYQAVRTMVIRVLLDLSFFLVVVIAISDPVIINSFAFTILWMKVLMYPTCQALLLILGNPKLKSAVCGLMKALV